MSASGPNLLVVNFEMDPASPVLAWQYQVVCALAHHCRDVTVVTQRAVACPLPHNVRLHVIPSWQARAPWRWLGANWLAGVRLGSLLRRSRVDVCFVHMNMEWAYRFHAWLRWFGIPTLLWYAHGSTSLRLRLAHRCADLVVTSSADGFRLRSRKLRVIGQGIDTDLFRPRRQVEWDWAIVTVGRISERKRLERMIQLIVELKRLLPQRQVVLKIVGQPLTRRDRRYHAKLMNFAQALGVSERVVFVGHVPRQQLPEVYRRAWLHLNLSSTGSMDKAVLEALACGCPSFTSNKAFADFFERRGLGDLLLQGFSPAAVARRLVALNGGRAGHAGLQFHRAVAAEHSLNTYVQRVLAQATELMRRRRTNAPTVIVDRPTEQEGHAGEEVSCTRR